MECFYEPGDSTLISSESLVALAAIFIDLGIFGDCAPSCGTPLTPKLYSGKPKRKLITNR